MVRERVRAVSDVVEVIGQYVTLKRAGRSWKGLCPFHQEKTPSFTVSPERQTFHCFGCGAGGDVFRFVQEVERLTFPEALRLLAGRAGIPLPRLAAGEGMGGKLTELCEEAAALYRRSLLDPGLGGAARALLRARGIGEEVEERFGLGFAPPGWDFLTGRLEKRFGAALLLQAGLAVERERGGLYDRFRERLVVPLRQPSGRVVGFGGRALGQEEPKYLNSPETAVYRKGQFLFGLGEARAALQESREPILVEGYFDCLVLHQAGFRSAVAVAGTALTPEQARLLRRYADGVVLCLDGDAAGRAAQRRALAPLLSAGLALRVASLAEGEDPDSLVRRRGAAALEAVVEGAVSPAAYLCADAARGPAAHAAALSAVLELAAQVAGLPEREALLVESDRWLGVGVDRLRGELEKRARPGRPAALAEPEGERPEVLAKELSYLERSLLELLAASPEARRAALGLPAQWLVDERGREIVAALTAEPDAEPGAWLGAVSPGAQRALGRALAEGRAPADALRALEDHRRRLEARSLRAEQEEWRRRLGAGEAPEGALRRLQDIAERLFALAASEVEVVGKGEGE
jgi:DNA primase